MAYDEKRNKYKSFIVAFIATTALLLFSYTTYLTISKLNSTKTVKLALSPAISNECPKCAITIYTDNTASITLDKQGKTETVTGFIYADQDQRNDGSLTFRLTTNHNKPSIVFFGAKLKTTNTQQAAELGYKLSSNGMGYVIVPPQSDLNGISGSIPIQWVANSQE